MPGKNPRRRAADRARPTIASLGMAVTLVPREEDAELRALVARYEELVAEWQRLSQRALTVLAGRSNWQPGR